MAGWRFFCPSHCGFGWRTDLSRSDYRGIVVLSMSQPRSTINSLSAGLFLTSSSVVPPSSAAPVVVTAASSTSATSFSSEIAVAVAHALENSLPAIISAVRENTAPISSVPPVFASVDSGHAMVVESSLAASSGTLRLPAFVSTFPSVPAITGSNSSRPVAAFTSPVMATHVTGAFSGFDGPVLSPSFDKAFVVGPGHAPVSAKLVSKITGGLFVDLADLLSANLHSVEHEPQTFLDGKLLVSNRRRVLEIKDILTWTEAFTIFQMVMCSAHPHRWPDLTKYKLLIIQTARISTELAWLEYDLAFRKDAAVTGTSDWSRMNLDLYNFHLRTSPPMTTLHSSTPSATTVSTSWGNSAVVPYCFFWNNGRCRWPFRECRYCHVCNSCDGDHCRANCPFHPFRGARSRFPSPSAAPKRGGGSEEEHLPQLLVNSVHSIVPVDPEQEPGCFSSQAMVSLHPGGSPSGFVPVRLYSPLAPVS